MRFIMSCNSIESLEKSPSISEEEEETSATNTTAIKCGVCMEEIQCCAYQTNHNANVKITVKPTLLDNWTFTSTPLVHTDLLCKDCIDQILERPDPRCPFCRAETKAYEKVIQEQKCEHPHKLFRTCVQSVCDFIKAHHLDCPPFTIAMLPIMGLSLLLALLIDWIRVKLNS